MSSKVSVNLPEETPMRRIALVASFVAGAALSVALLPAEASAVSLPVQQQAALAGSSDIVLVRRGGGFRGGFRGHRGFGYRGYRGFRGHAFRGRRFAYRGGVWRRHGWRRGWRGPAWGLALGAPYYGYGYGCPLVRRTVWTPRGWRVRWVRRCW
jgi:hypothetical protein